MARCAFARFNAVRRNNARRAISVYRLFAPFDYSSKTVPAIQTLFAQLTFFVRNNGALDIDLFPFNEEVIGRKFVPLFCKILAR